MNKILSVRIYNDKTAQWDNYTRYAVLPIKIADLLDEQLDEAELTLKYVPKEYFNPLTIVQIQLESMTNAPMSTAYFQKVLARGQTTIGNRGIVQGKAFQQLTRTFIVANDNANQVMGLTVKRGANVGKSVYNHQLYLIEITKIAEGFIGDAITYTNTLGNDYVGE